MQRPDPRFWNPASMWEDVFRAERYRSDWAAATVRSGGQFWTEQFKGQIRRPNETMMTISDMPGCTRTGVDSRSVVPEVMDLTE